MQDSSNNSIANIAFHSSLPYGNENTENLHVTNERLVTENDRNENSSDNESNELSHRVAITNDNIEQAFAPIRLYDVTHSSRVTHNSHNNLPEDIYDTIPGSPHPQNTVPNDLASSDASSTTIVIDVTDWLETAEIINTNTTRNETSRIANPQLPASSNDEHHIPAEDARKKKSVAVFQSTIGGISASGLTYGLLGTPLYGGGLGLGLISLLPAIFVGAFVGSVFYKCRAGEPLTL